MQVKGVADDTADSRRNTARPPRTARVSKSVVGWTPGVTDWLTQKARPVGRTGNVLFTERCC